MDFLNNVLNTLSETVGKIAPGILGALVVFIIGMLLAGIISRIIKRLFKKTSIDENIEKRLNFKFSLAKAIAKLAYYIFVVITLLLVLEMMGIHNVLAPLQNMVNEFLGYLPNIVAAGIIGFVGYILATLASEAMGFVSTSAEKMSKKMGLKNPMSLTKLIKQIVFIIVFIPILIVALDALKMKAISEPATAMFNTFLGAIPNIVSAALILGVFYFVGKYITAMLADLLSNLNVDTLGEKVGISKFLGDMSLSKLIGNLAFFFLMFTAVISASEKLGFDTLNDILHNVFNIAGQVFFGLIILILGSFIANLAADTLQKTSQNTWLASIVRFAIIGIFIAFGLHTMGIAQNIVTMAFGLTLGAIAVAFALAFGLGGRQAAGKQLDYLFSKMRENGNNETEVEEIIKESTEDKGYTE